jgi:biotin carboxyl carrier protein
MKFKVKIDEQVFDIEVGDVTERPIIVLVDGETFSVWPEQEQVEGPAIKSAIQEAQAGIKPVEALAARAAPAKPGTGIRAPIPGVITVISVRLGDEVAIGDELCKLEAMKMNNSIRSNRAGKISAIHVNVGQQVKHNEMLIEFAEG